MKVPKRTLGLGFVAAHALADRHVKVQLALTEALDCNIPLAFEAAVAFRRTLGVNCK